MERNKGDQNAHLKKKILELEKQIREHATEHKQTEEQLLKKNKDLARLFNMSLDLLESLDRKEVLLKIVENAANLVGTDTSAIYFVKGNDLFLEATFPPLPAEYPEEFRYAKLENHPYIKAVIESLTTIIVNDVSKATLTEEERLITKIRNLGSLVYIPLLVQKKVEGVIILGTIGRKHEFEQEEIDLFSTFSNITSLALENSYLFGNLKIAMEKAEESSQLKTAFLHNISHEIRTPLNAIIGFSGFLVQEGISPKLKRDYMDIISQSNNQLLSIIDDILKISQIEAGQVIINETTADLNVILNNLYRQYLPLATKKKLGFSVNNAFPVHKGSVRIDENKVIGIISNLLNNAFKFTHKGSVEMGCTMQDDWIEFYVSDTGIGIPENEHARIFDRFYQIDKSDMGTYGGMGLGLSISAAYVDMLGGKFLLDSVPGKGSRFAFRLPLSKNPAFLQGL